jgi:hypothetical protein
MYSVVKLSYGFLYEVGAEWSIYIVVILPVYLYNHCSPSPLHCEFEPLFVSNKIGCTRLVTVHDKVCQLPAQGRRLVKSSNSCEPKMIMTLHTKFHCSMTYSIGEMELVQNVTIQTYVHVFCWQPFPITD